MVSYCCYNKFAQIHGWKEHKFILLQFGKSKVCNEFYRATCWQSWFLLNLLRGGKAFSFLFSFCPLLEVILIPWLVITHHIGSFSPSFFLPHGLFPSLTFLTLSYKTFRLHLWFIRKIQNNRSQNPQFNYISKVPFAI